MGYVFYKALHQMKANWKKYLLLAVELSVGTAILLSGLNSKWSMNARLTELQGQSEAGMLNIEPQGIPGSTATDSSGAISYGLFQTLSGKYSGLCYAAFSQDILLAGGETAPMSIVFVSAPLFQWWFGTSPQPGAAYCGKNISPGEGDKTGFNKLVFQNGSVTVGNASYPLRPLENKKGRGEIDFSAVQGDGFLPENTMFLPADAAAAVPLTSLRAKLVVIEPDAATAAKVGYEASAALYRANPQYLYAVSDPFAQAKKGIDDMTGTIRTLTFLASLSFVIVAAGMLGALLILLQRRRKEIAISLMLGATFPRVVAELLTEVFLVCVLGCGFGSLWAVLLTPLLSVSYQDVVFHPVTLALALALAAAITLAACALALVSVKNRHPIQTLRQEM